MAGSYAIDGSVRILVKNIPTTLHYDKLTIYFQRQNHGGCGDVISVTFPKSKREPDQAVVEFSSAKSESMFREKKIAIFECNVVFAPLVYVRAKEKTLQC